MSYLPTIDPKLALQFMLVILGLGLGVIIGLIVGFYEGRYRAQLAHLRDLTRLSRKMTDHAYEDAIKTGRRVVEMLP